MFHKVSGSAISYAEGKMRWLLENGSLYILK